MIPLHNRPPLPSLANDDTVSTPRLRVYSLEFRNLRSAWRCGQLRSGIHTVRVTLSGGTLFVYLDGALVTSAKASSLPATSLLAFTASTGGKTDVHAIRNASLAASAW